MADNYIKVLSVGIGMFILFIILSYVIPIPSSFHSSSSSSVSSKSYKQIIDERGYYYLKTFPLKDFGSYEVSRKNIEIGKGNVGYSLSYRVIRKDDSFIIKNGIFSKKEKTYNFETHDSKKIRISFVVNRTNNYGRLIIDVNGKEVFRNYTYEGEKISIVIKDDISSTNSILFSCESSGARIWAPTAYEISNLRIEVLDYSNAELSRDVYLEPDEYKGLKDVEIKFNVIQKSGSGKLKVYVNHNLAKEDYYTPSAKLNTITLYKNLFSPGLNTIILRCDKDTNYILDNILITVTYLSSQRTTRSQLSLILSPTTYDYIENENVSLFLEFDVSRVLVDKGIEVEINGHAYKLDTLSVGKNILAINKEDLEDGINSIALSTEGYYYIPRMKIGIRKGEEYGRRD